MERGQVFKLKEEASKGDYLLATYYIELAPDEDIIAKTSAMALGQTIGTWVSVPGLTDEMRENHMGKVVNIFDIPPYELFTQVQEEKCPYLVQIAYPVVNFGPQFPMMLTTLLGNDASTSAQVKLLDLEFPESFANQFNGPNFGIEGFRKLTGVYDRPLLLNMIKPCTGFSPKVGAKIFYETALGGVDLIKDDELLGNPSYCKAVDRVKEYNAASKAVYEETGKKVTYLVNITDRADKLLDNAKRVIDAGAKAVMVNFATVGYSALQALAREIDVPILGHYAGTGALYEGVLSGMSSPLAVGKFPRLAGADMVITNTPYGGYPLKYQKYIQTINALSLDFYQIKPAFPAVGGGLHPGLVELYMKDLGKDIVLACGGAIQGHPQGPAAGARAMRQAIDAVVQGLPMEEAKKDHEELKTALDLWGYRKP